MAAQELIDQVKANLPEDASADNWDDTFIGSMLDSGLSVTKVTLAFWSSRVGKLSTVVDVTESGSSRQLSNLFNQAKQMYEIWLAKSNLEDNPVPTGRSRIRFHKMTRV